MTRFYNLYVLLHGYHHADPDKWSMNRCNATLTTAAEAAPGWRVVGITPAALTKFAEHDYRRQPGMGVTRGHLRPRLDRMRELMAPATPFGEAEFLDIWYRDDSTVLCAKGENHAVMPDYIAIDNDDGVLFSSTMTGWVHRRPEQDYLRQLHAVAVLG